MWIERDRIRALHAAEGAPPALGQHEESAVGGIHVQPQPLRAREVRGRGDVVDGAGVRGAGAHDQEERAPARGPIRGHCFGQGVERLRKQVVKHGRDSRSFNGRTSRERSGFSEYSTASHRRRLCYAS